MGPLKWDYQARSDGHSSGSAARIPPPNFADNNFCEDSGSFRTFYLSFLISTSTRVRERDDTFLRVTQHQPPGGAVLAAPAHFHSNPWDWGVQHLGSQGVCVLLLSADPLPDHPRAHHRVVAAQILKQEKTSSANKKRIVQRRELPPTTHLRSDSRLFPAHLQAPKQGNVCLSLTEFN